MEAALGSEGVDGGEWSIAYLRDGPILELNRRWLAHDWVPDVLSFALQEANETPIGDIYVGVEQAKRQAKELGIPFEEELVRLTVHGVLHVLGYDHPESGRGREHSPLYRKQEALVRELMAGRDRRGGPAAPPGKGA